MIGLSICRPYHDPGDRLHRCLVLKFAYHEGTSRHMNAVSIAPPSGGEKIRIANGKLQVPDRPIIPFIEGDGTGTDI